MNHQRVLGATLLLLLLAALLIATACFPAAATRTDQSNQQSEDLTSLPSSGFSFMPSLMELEPSVAEQEEVSMSFLSFADVATPPRDCYSLNTSQRCMSAPDTLHCVWCNGAATTGPYCCPKAGAARCNAHCASTPCSAYQTSNECQPSWQFAGGRAYKCFWCNSRHIATSGPYCASEIEYNPSCPSCSDLTTQETCTTTHTQLVACTWCSGHQTAGKFCVPQPGFMSSTPSHFFPQCASCTSYTSREACTNAFTRDYNLNSCSWCNGARDVGSFCYSQSDPNSNCPSCENYAVTVSANKSAANTRACRDSLDQFGTQCGVCWKARDGDNDGELAGSCLPRDPVHLLYPPNPHCAASCRDLATIELCVGNRDAYGNPCIWCGASSGPARHDQNLCYMEATCPPSVWREAHPNRDTCESNRDFRWCSGSADTGKEFCAWSNEKTPVCGTCMQYTTTGTCGRGSNARGWLCEWCNPETDNGPFCSGKDRADSNPRCSCSNFKERGHCEAASGLGGDMCNWCNGNVSTGPYCGNAPNNGDLRNSAPLQTNVNCPSCSSYRDSRSCSDATDFQGFSCQWCISLRKCLSQFERCSKTRKRIDCRNITSRVSCVSAPNTASGPRCTWCNETANVGAYCADKVSDCPSQHLPACSSFTELATCLNTDRRCLWCDGAAQTGPYCFYSSVPGSCSPCTSYTTYATCINGTGLSGNSCFWCSGSDATGSYCTGSGNDQNPNCARCETLTNHAECAALGCTWNSLTKTEGQLCYDSQRAAPATFLPCSSYQSRESCSFARAPSSQSHCVWCNGTARGIGEICVAPDEVTSQCQPCSRYASWASCVTNVDAIDDVDRFLIPAYCSWCNPNARTGSYCTSSRAPNTEHCDCTSFTERTACREALDPLGKNCNWCLVNASTGPYCSSASAAYYVPNENCPACESRQTHVDCAGVTVPNGLACSWCRVDREEGNFCVDPTEPVDRHKLRCTDCPSITSSSVECQSAGCTWCSDDRGDGDFCTSADQPNPACKPCLEYASEEQCNAHIDPSSLVNCTWCNSQVCSPGTCGSCFSLMVPNFVIQPYALSAIGVVKDFLLLVFFSLFWQLTYCVFVVQRKVSASLPSFCRKEAASSLRRYALVFLHEDECVVTDCGASSSSSSGDDKPHVSHHETVVRALTGSQRGPEATIVSDELVWFAVHALRAWNKTIDDSPSASSLRDAREDTENEGGGNTRSTRNRSTGDRRQSENAAGEASSLLLQNRQRGDGDAKYENGGTFERTATKRPKSLTKPKHVLAVLRRLPLMPAFYVASRRPLARVIASWHNFPGTTLMSLYCIAAIAMLALTTNYVFAQRAERNLSLLDCVLLIGYRMVNSGASQTLLLNWFQGCKRSNRVRLRVTQMIPRLLLLHTALFSPFLVLGVVPGLALYAHLFVPMVLATIVVYCCGALLAWRLCFGRWRPAEAGTNEATTGEKDGRGRSQSKRSTFGRRSRVATQEGTCEEEYVELDADDDDDLNEAENGVGQADVNDAESTNIFLLADDGKGDATNNGTMTTCGTSTSGGDTDDHLLGNVDGYGNLSRDASSRRKPFAVTRFFRDVETRLADVHSATPTLPLFRRVAVILIAFLTERALPVLILSIVMQMAYNYAVLHLYTHVFGYWDVVGGEFDARSMACFIAQVKRDVRLTLNDVTDEVQTWSSFAPFL